MSWGRSTYAPLDIGIEPVMDLVGTAAEQKGLILVETGHIPSTNFFIEETLAWFDRCLGPVNI